jgi:hypothetical protein
MGTIQIDGSTPKLTIGNATAEDALILFDGAAQDFYIGLDDSADDLIIGLGSAVGTTPAISINEDRDVTISDGAIDFDVASHDTSNGLKLGGTLVTATAAELNIMDGVTSTAAEINLIDGGTARGTTALASGDGILINDGGTMRMTNVDTVKTYMTGTIAQVLSDTKTDTTSITSNTFAQISGLTIDITPSASSSKVLVLVQLYIGNNSTTTYLRLMRDSTSIFQSDTSSNIPRATTGSNIGQYVLNPAPMIYLDSPSSTSALTYSIYWRSDDSATSYLNRSHADRDTANYDPRGVSSITVMEVLA